MPIITTQTVEEIAKLANLHLTDAQKEKFAPQLSSVLEYTKHMDALVTDDVEETSQVTGLENVLREDMVEEARMFSQDEALSQAKNTFEGKFLVPAVFEE
jgi:aspartyl-tRNA(Asn)/glutamyl-tRNA(Gln) amidotransferase subunit C